MIQIDGKYTSAKLYTDNVEDTALEQIRNMVDSVAFEGSKIRIMPDVHAGAGVPIGFTATFKDKVIPNVVGVDIGCAVLSVNIGPTDIDFAKLDAFIRQNIPHGFAVNSEHKRQMPATDLDIEIEEVCAYTNQDLNRVMLSIGTLGGGNHYEEIGKDQNGDHWLTVHTGSRNFGLKIAEFYQNIAINKCGDMKGLEFLEGDDCSDYLHDMSIAQEYAQLNRSTILAKILCGMNMYEYARIESVHNYIDFSVASLNGTFEGIIRKGAISAQAGQDLLIPINMRDGMIIGKGKGNYDWNWSAPHGAGRLKSRGAAKRDISLEEYQASMEGIWTSCVGENTLDEAPQAYKNMDEIIANISPNVDIISIVKPVYNFKSDSNTSRKKKKGQVKIDE